MHDSNLRRILIKIVNLLKKLKFAKTNHTDQKNVNDPHAKDGLRKKAKGDFKSAIDTPPR